MSKITDSQRIQELESIRNSENTMLVDEAIVSGKTASQLAHSILSDRSHAMGKSITGDALSDSIVSGINAKRGGQTLQGSQPLNQKQEVSAVPANESLVDIMSESVNKNRQAHRRNSH